MNMRSIVYGVAVACVSLSAPLVGAQAAQSLGSVRLTRALSANGQPLPAGTYTVRLSSDPVTPVVGQSSESAQWVEFVQGGQVKGRELASVVSPADTKQVAKGAPPAPGTVRVQPLRGADYVRIWLNRGGTQYLVHLNAK
jgi:hypothetical protein